MRTRVVFFFACTWLAPLAVAQQPVPGLSGEPVVDQDEQWSYEQNYASKPDPRTIIQFKAQRRAAERMDRMASMQWYGMSNARPTATTTPFCSMYSPAWQVPGGRPFGWFHSQRSPVIIVR